MPEIITPLDGSGPQIFTLSCFQDSVDNLNNFTRYRVKIVYNGMRSIDYNTTGTQTWSIESSDGLLVLNGTYTITSLSAGTTLTIQDTTFDRYHDPDGYAASFNMTAELTNVNPNIGNGTASLAMGTPDRIPKRPQAPSVPTFSNVLPLACTVHWFPPSDNGGLPITNYVLQRAISQNSRVAEGLNGPGFTNPQFLDEKTVSGETLSTTWGHVSLGSADKTVDYRVIAKNSAADNGGRSDPSPSSSPYSSLGGPYIKVGGVYRPSSVFVKVSGVYRPATPYIKVSGVYRPVS